ncbi:ATP-binding cassette domain-containing protein [Gilvibacter sediminis]|uniref:ATP-binding cassette domain-containing protein n=1 Tax=Gilvibacter sediminis TaxID=379071 RepID=UPI002350263E|nr:ATP-binding cassette domain-containing protein [Gilvibacter sediminis]MDC7998150.1 ATP-binding cassette domain-containing protein [Gilvibacter sediminis]
MIDITLQKSLNSQGGKITLDLSLQIAAGSFNALFGPSGAGKTSTLKMISGLLKPDTGSIQSHGDIWFDSQKKINLAPGKRKIAYVFQDAALFPNMSVLENIKYAAGADPDKAYLENLISSMGLEKLVNHKPDMLSGGQAKRAALARALAQKPELLLLDEPFSALDQSAKIKLQQHLSRLHQDYGFTVILVSHDHAEVMQLAQNAFVIEDGKLLRSGTPAEVFGLESASDEITVMAQIIDHDTESITVMHQGRTYRLTWEASHQPTIGSWINIRLKTSNAQINALNKL